MFLVFSFFVFFLIIIYSKTEIDLYYINIKKNKINVNAKIYITFFKIIKFAIVKFESNTIKILFKKIDFKKIKIRTSFKTYKEKIYKIKNFKFKFESVLFNLKIGLINRNITNLAIVIISCIFPIFLRNRLNNKVVKYKIFPNYEDLCLELNGKISVSIENIELFKSLLKYIKIRFEHNNNKNSKEKESFENEWASYWKSYENGDG